jgi:hypothetical protein
MEFDEESGLETWHEEEDDYPDEDKGNDEHNDDKDEDFEADVIDKSLR